MLHYAIKWHHNHLNFFNKSGKLALLSSVLKIFLILVLIFICCLFAAELITVGWGKKETQFHGTEGKPTAADLKPKVCH